jgi:hypothetical protein
MGAALEPLGNLSEPLGGLSVNIHRAGGREKTGRKEGEKAGEIALSEYSPAVFQGCFGGSSVGAKWESRAWVAPAGR